MVFASDFSCQGFLSSSMRVQASPDFYSGMTGFDTSHLQAGQSADIPTSLGVLLMLTSYFKLLLRNLVVFGHLRALMHLLHIVGSLPRWMQSSQHLQESFSNALDTTSHPTAT